MPNLFAPDAAASSRSSSRQRARTEANEHRSMWNRLSLQKIGSWLKREEDEVPPQAPPVKLGTHVEEENKDTARPHSSGEHHGRVGGFLNRRSSRRAIPGLPRPLTFKRMNSEKRDKLLPVPVDGEQRRAASADRRESTPVKRDLSVPRISLPSMSAPDIMGPHDDSDGHQKPQPTIGGGLDSNIPAGARQVDYAIDASVDYAIDSTVDYAIDASIDYLPASEPPPLSIAGDSFYEKGSQRSGTDIDEIQLQEELEAKWILNLSMHFRDLSDREKFFVTYAEEPTKWRRVTVSCDYRELSPESLESDLKSLHYQRDKSARIYEAIRDSLPDIQFYDTVTNLKLQTSDGRLHVHVTEDVNEIIPYPSLSAVEHLECKRFKESAISFDSHISGFVYKVGVNHKVLIKKEIPGPDAVEEFLYEINALCSLQDSRSVIKFEGIIVDENNELIKGLLISYAEHGALVDVLYDFKNSDHMHWARREKWARQIVQGLSEIHEAGFVQGDFTLSNIVIDRNDDAKIIDINRRGCPVGWEPPELARLIESGQRISIYIGVKSDLYQLGMVLWALAEQQDEPERQERPLYRTLSKNSTIPTYFRDIVKACLSDSPRGRPTATNLLAKFPKGPVNQLNLVEAPHENASTHRSDKEYIDPATAVGLEDIPKHRQRSRSSFSNLHMPSPGYIGSNGSYIMPNSNAARGRSPGVLRSNSRNRQSDCSPYPAPRSIMSLDDSELENELASLPASRETRWEQIYIDGDTKLVQRGCGDIDVHDFASQEPKDFCITTPPGELESSFVGSRKSDDTPLSLSTVTEMLPTKAQQVSPLVDTFEKSGSGSLGRNLGHRQVPSDKVQQVSPITELFGILGNSLPGKDLGHRRVPSDKTQQASPVVGLHEELGNGSLGKDLDHRQVSFGKVQQVSPVADLLEGLGSASLGKDFGHRRVPSDKAQQISLVIDSSKDLGEGSLGKDLGYRHIPSGKAQQVSPIADLFEEPGSASFANDLGHRRVPSSKASFSDRVHHLSQIEDPSHTLANLEEIAMAASISSAAPSRVGTGFSIAERFSSPIHQDSGFAEPTRASYESDRIRQPPEISLADLALAQGSAAGMKSEEWLWDTKNNTMFGNGVKPIEIMVKPPQEAKGRVTEEAAREKALEEKVSNTTIRPPSILIPEFHHKGALAMDSSPSKRPDSGADLQSPIRCGNAELLPMSREEAEFGCVSASAHNETKAHHEPKAHNEMKARHEPKTHNEMKAHSEMKMHNAIKTHNETKAHNAMQMQNEAKAHNEMKRISGLV